MSTNLQSELQLIKKSLAGAGELVMKGLPKIQIAKEKGDTQFHDYATNLDQDSEKYITSLIQKTFPEDAILSEESMSDTKTDVQRLWIVDPIDGTKNAFRGSENFFVSISLVLRGDLEISAVLCPPRNETYIAQRGRGVLYNGEKLTMLHPNASLRESVVGFGFPHSGDADWLKDYLNMTGDVRLVASDIHRTGCAVYDNVEVITGRAGAYVATDTTPWDTAFGVLAVQEMGGVVTKPSGDTFKLLEKVEDGYSLNVVMCKSSQIRDDLLPIIQPHFERVR